MLAISLTAILTIFALESSFESSKESSYAFALDSIPTNSKVVILSFDDGRKDQFSIAKPLLDKYGFKATFYVVCNYVGNKKGYMNWTELEMLQNEGHDIESHSMSHRNLLNLPQKQLIFELAGSKECLQQHGINAASFAYPFDAGYQDANVVNIVAKYYDFARTAGSPVTFLHCDGWKNKSSQTDCSTYDTDGKLTYANRYSLRGWSHDFSRLVNSYSDANLYNRFVDVVNTQVKYNKNGTIEAIPIIIYHRMGERVLNYLTNSGLFEKEMKYLYDNNFKVLTMKDLRYDNEKNYFYIQ
jgi:peptidoglycan/xylan/chitin deacetylase (PgdA/CDA1 family)